MPYEVKLNHESEHVCYGCDKILEPETFVFIYHSNNSQTYLCQKCGVDEVLGEIKYDTEMLLDFFRHKQ